MCFSFLPQRWTSACICTPALQVIGCLVYLQHRADRQEAVRRKLQLKIPTEMHILNALYVWRMLLKPKWHQHIPRLNRKMLHSEYGLIQNIQTEYAVHDFFHCNVLWSDGNTSVHVPLVILQHFSGAGLQTTIEASGRKKRLLKIFWYLIGLIII